MNLINAPLIVTLKLDNETFEFFDGLRTAHFPPERNFLKAHITLFHNLAGAEIEHVRRDLMEVAAQFDVFEIRFPSARFLGTGTAIEIESAELIQLREDLKRRWLDKLKPQDLQKFKPHITVQNKVAPDAARILYEEFSANWTLKVGKAKGLQLWHYLNGPWKLSEEFDFRSEARA